MRAWAVPETGKWSAQDTCTHTHAHAHICIHTCIHAHTRAHTYTPTSLYTYVSSRPTYVHAHIATNWLALAYSRTRTYTHTRTHMCISRLAKLMLSFNIEASHVYQQRHANTPIGDAVLHSSDPTPHTNLQIYTQGTLTCRNLEAEAGLCTLSQAMRTPRQPVASNVRLITTRPPRAAARAATPCLWPTSVRRRHLCAQSTPSIVYITLTHTPHYLHHATTPPLACTHHATAPRTSHIALLFFHTTG